MRSELDEIVYDRRFHPFYGWHDDHRGHDRTMAYAPAMQQNRAEFHAFVGLLNDKGCRGRGLQLGLGASGASHAVMHKVFDHAFTIDIDAAKVAAYEQRIGNRVGLILGDTCSNNTMQRLAAAVHIDVEWLSDLGPIFDCVFIDADHTLDGVRHDFERYSQLVRPGGVIAMHDALKRPTYENEIQVWRFIDELRAQGRNVNMIGEELGIAWLVRE